MRHMRVMCLWTGMSSACQAEPARGKGRGVSLEGKVKSRCPCRSALCCVGSREHLESFCAGVQG